MGKHALVSLVFLLVVYLSPGLTKAHRKTQEEAEVVRDTEGNPLEVGSQYVIQAVQNGWFGPPIVSSGRFVPAFACPQYPVVSPFMDVAGQPIKFIPVDGAETEIHVSSPLQIDSGFSPYCRSDGLWKVALDPFNRRQAIVAAGALGVSPATFKIQLAPVVGPLRYAYKISLVGEHY